MIWLNFDDKQNGVLFQCYKLHKAINMTIPLVIIYHCYITLTHESELVNIDAKESESKI